ncbi:MAG: PhzF family phenazine biosynthesis protein [Candidatus Nanopelagicales bacterium]|nr:PhzF family phenazine biosynthesis protein [Candidatus Nanopelagicales bacterium]
MAIALAHVDAFSSEPFAGNPAAVCLLPQPKDPVWLQSVAQEMNLSETAFLVRRGGSDFDLRWFTPTCEVDLCGHATLASAHVLWELGVLAESEPARFHTASGVLTASSRDGWIELDFPAIAARPCPPPEGLLAALGVEADYVGRSASDYLVEVSQESTVRQVRPDFELLKQLPVQGVIVTSASNGGFDFVSRYFAPAAGIDEDPVTGSAHCCLAPFWSRKLGRSRLVGEQVSARGGIVRVALADDRVKLAGQAVTVAVGELMI